MAAVQLHNKFHAKFRRRLHPELQVNGFTLSTCCVAIYLAVPLTIVAGADSRPTAALPGHRDSGGGRTPVGGGDPVPIDANAEATRLPHAPHLGQGRPGPGQLALSSPIVLLF